MELNKEIAQKIVKRTMSIIRHSVNVMDKNGIIIASGNSARLGQKHIGAILVLRHNEILSIDETLASKWNFEVLPGINLPINYLGKILGVVGISGSPNEVKQYGELVKMTAELIVEQHILLEKSKWVQRYREEFISQLIKGRFDSEQQLQEQANFFSFDLLLPRFVILIKLLQPSLESLQELICYLEQSSFRQDIAVLALDEIAVLHPFQQEKGNNQVKLVQQFLTILPPTKKFKLAVGVISNYPTKNLANSYTTAISTLIYGQKFFPKKEIYFFDHYKLPVLLNDGIHSWKANEILAPFQNLCRKDPSLILQKTLTQYFFSNCDLALTAERLFIHINTLRYRLNKIEQITSLSFNKIDEKFILYLGCILQYKFVK